MRTLTIHLLVVYLTEYMGRPIPGMPKKFRPNNTMTTINPADLEVKTDMPPEEAEKGLIVYPHIYNNTNFHYQNNQDPYELPRPKGLIFKHTCMRQYLKCLISQSSPEPVCAYNNPFKGHFGYVSATSSCDIYFDNCRRGYRVWRILDTGRCMMSSNYADEDNIAKDKAYRQYYMADYVKNRGP